MPSIGVAFIGGGLDICVVSLGGPNGFGLDWIGAGDAGAEVTDMGGWKRFCCVRWVWFVMEGGSMRLLIEGDALARLTTRAGGETGGRLLEWWFWVTGTVDERIGSYS